MVSNIGARFTRKLSGMIWPFSLMLAAPIIAYAQSDLVDAERIEDWFYSRLAWAAVLGVIAGALVGAAHLSRLKFPLNALHINGVARRRFGLWTVAVFVVGGLFLLIDAWLLYPFGNASLSFWDAIVQVWLNYRTLLVLVVVMGAFGLSVAVTTRITPRSHCPYAFLPGPRGR